MGIAKTKRNFSALMRFGNRQQQRNIAVERKQSASPVISLAISPDVGKTALLEAE
jgi:hypothetical protein